MKDKKEGTAWEALSSTWKKIAAVIAAVGVLSKFVVDLFNVDIKYVLPVFSFIGLLILLEAWYVDKQAEHEHKELQEHISEANKMISEMTEGIKSLNDITLETRRDTLRIQLSMYMQSQPDNVDTILKLAETYFIKLKGNWYMASEFAKWAKAHNIEIPPQIFSVISSEIE